MGLNISGINKDLSSNISLKLKKANTPNEKTFSELCDPISQAIRKHVKDPVDREEDLLFWKNTCDSGIKFQKQNPNYDDFLELKKAVMCFPPQTASGRVRRSYREMMDKLPKNVADDLRYTLNCTYNTFVRNRNMDSSNFGAIIDAMTQYTGRVGNPATTDFSLINQVLLDLKNKINENTNEDESVRQILI